MRKMDLNSSAQQIYSPHNPHKFPKYKIKSPSITKANFSHHRHLSNTFSLNFHQVSPKLSNSKISCKKNKISLKNHQSLSSSLKDPSKSSEIQTKKYPNFFNQKLDKPYLNLDYLQEKIQKDDKYVEEDKKRKADMQFFSARQSSKNILSSRKQLNLYHSNLQQQPKKPAFLKNSTHKLFNKSNKNLKLSKQNEPLQKNVYKVEKLILQQNFLKDNSVKLSIVDDSYISKSSQVIATHREIADENGWLPFLTNDAKMVDSILLD